MNDTSGLRGRTPGATSRRRFASYLLVPASAWPPALFLVGAALLFTPSTPGDAQTTATKTFRARLSPVPIDLTMASTIAGIGRVTAVLNGSKLNVNGTFEGLKSPATVARLHKAPRGIRGAAVLDLAVTNGTNGTITGTLDLTPQQVQDLQNSRLYVQLYSEKAPEGNLWGWLLPQEVKTQETKPRENK